MPWAKVIPVIDPSVRGLCKRAYPNHPQGCPNFDKKEGCPPSAPIINKTLDLKKTVWAVWNIFPFGEHIKKMKDKHPQWSQRQLECCLYWQGTARKQLRTIIKEHLREEWKDQPDTHLVVACPEAQGVNLTETMKQTGLILEWPPVTRAVQIVLVGVPIRD